MRDSWPVLQPIRFALAEEPDGALSLPFKTVLLLLWHLRFLVNARQRSGGDDQSKQDQGGL